MKAIGYWIKSLRDEKYFPPQAFVGIQEPVVKDRVIEYLSNGKVYRKYRGFSWCRFRCNLPHQEMGACDLTDGKWVWPEGLAHYVDKHDVKLPTDFVNQTKNTIGFSGDVNSLPLPSDEYWVEWCNKTASQDIKEKLLEARENAEIEYLRLRREYFDRVEKEKGITDVECMTRGCTKRSLNGIVFCAECANKLEAIDPGEAAYCNMEAINA